MRTIDTHVHIVGNGLNGSGCWLRLKSRFHKWLAGYMLHQLGLPQDLLQKNLEEGYIQRLAQLIDSSSLGGAVILAQERVYDDKGRIVESTGSAYVPNSYVFKIAARYAKFLPAVSIHPARSDAYEKLEACIKAGAVLMKCLPCCQNIDCSDKRYLPFWQKMAAAGLPLLAHTGGELSLPVANRKLCSPEILRLPLECGVKVIAAHAGTSSLYLDPDYTKIAAEMLRSYPNFYVDNSGLNTPIRSRHLKKLLEEPFLSRVVHGSDVPIPVSALWARCRGLISANDYRRLKEIANPLELDLQIKRAMGFPEESFTRLWNLLRLPQSPAAAAG